MMRARCARVHNQLLHAFSRSAWVALHVFDVQRAEDSCGWSCLLRTACSCVERGRP